MDVEHKEYASNAKGNTGVALGSVALGTSVLNSLASGNGILGGILGGGNAAAINAAKDAEIAQLKAERYCDNVTDSKFERLMTTWIKPIADSVAKNEVEKAELKGQIDVLKKDVEIAELKAQCCCDKNKIAIDGINAVLAQITKVTVVTAA